MDIGFIVQTILFIHAHTPCLSGSEERDKEKHERLRWMSVQPVSLDEFEYFVI